MPGFDDEIRIIVEVGLNKRKITFHKRPTSQEMNLLFILSEACGTIVHPDDVCHRLKVSLNGASILATRLRKKLTGKWVLDVVNNKGFRLLFVPYQTNDPDDKFSEKLQVLPLEDQIKKGLHYHEDETKMKISLGVHRNARQRIFRYIRETWPDNDCFAHGRSAFQRQRG